MAITVIGYLILGLSVGAVVLFCWLGVECRRGDVHPSADTGPARKEADIST